MSPADPTPLDALTDGERATLSLLLVQGRSYHEISELLKIDSVRVRERAHAALETLAPAELQRPAAADRACIADYLVGEQSVSERVRTRAHLAGSGSDRAWATAIALALAPLAKDALPVIPDPDAAPPAEVEPRPPTISSAPERPSAPAGNRPARLSIVGLGLVVVVAVVLIIAVSGGHKSPPARATGTSGGDALPVIRTVKRLVLTPAGAGANASATAAIVRQPGGLVLLLQGRGLRPSQNDTYAVWLFNTTRDSRLLGFISPDISAGGTFSSGTPLPGNMGRFRKLIVTLETTSRPVTPGAPVLATRLKPS